ncbi:MAG: YciI family protein [Pseudomonadota bacterium]
MRSIVIFEEGPEMIPVREALEPAHLAFLEKHRAEIPMAGGLRDEHGGPYVGGLWVFEVASRQRAVELIEADPYYQANPRKYRLLAWGKALPQFQVLM